MFIADWILTDLIEIFLRNFADSAKSSKNLRTNSLGGVLRGMTLRLLMHNKVNEPDCKRYHLFM